MTDTMKQQVMTAPAEIIFQEVDIPKLGPEQVLIKIKRIGICGSDIHVYHGKHPYTKYPITQGHEVSGKIVAVGNSVAELAVGDKVTVEPQLVCGECYPCRHGKYNLCESLRVLGFQATGTASEYFAVDASMVDKLPDNMTYDEGAMIEPLAVTVHAAKQAGDIVGKDVVVLGCGPIGILLIQVLKALGARKVMATDISDLRLELAKECGADVTFNTKNVEFGKALVDTFGPDKADIMYDCAGNNITMEQAIQNARKGSVIILVAVFAGRADCDLAKLNDSELDLNTSMMYRHKDFEQAIKLVSEGKVALRPLMSKHFGFEKYKEAYEYIDANRETTMKVIVDVDPDDE